MRSLFIFCILFFSAAAFAALGENSTQCQVPVRVFPQICEEGGAFLCVNTPAGSVAEDFALLKGRLNLEGSGAGQISVATQHEYTKIIVNLSLSPPLKTNCWNQELSAENNFCLEAGGIFSIRVPLSELGPYTIFIAAARVQGASAQTTVRLSRVIAPTVTSDVVAFDPDISGGVIASGSHHVKVTLDLLAGCGASKENCDFIGASTGGVVVSVENKMTPSNKMVDCETNSIQGGAGKFVVGVPVWPGENRLVIKVCNAVTGFDKEHCPTIIPPPFRLDGDSPEIQILSPVPAGPIFWEESLGPELLRFRLAGAAPQTCDDSVQVLFNTQSSKRVCVDKTGIFETSLQSEEGYNIASIEAQQEGNKQTRSVVFGVGKRLSPFDSNGEVKPKEEWTLKKAGSFWIPSHFFQDLLSNTNDYFKSPEFVKMLSALPEQLQKKNPAGSAKTSDPFASTKAAIQKELGFCPAGGGLRDIQLKLAGAPRIGKIHWDSWEMQNGKIQTTLKAEDVSVAVQIFKDENGDGKPDIDPLPLKIAFKTLILLPILEASEGGGKFLLKLSSPYTDCSYKREGACFKMPALFTPKQFTGNASPAGAFAICDQTQNISKSMDKICRAINVLDRQTGGVFQEKILDSINRMYACGGSATLNAYFQDGFPIQVKKDFISFAGAMGVDSMVLKPEGVGIFLNTRFGTVGDLQQWPLGLRQGQAGIVIPASGFEAPNVFSGSHFSGGIALPVVSQIFWGLQGPHGKGFALTLDDSFFKKEGIDFEERCRAVEGEKKDPLCNIRPRAEEILGNPITAYGYLQPGDPVRLTIAPSRAFPLRVGFRSAEKKEVAIELANWNVTISSDKSDFITAKLSMKLTAQVGSPILSAGDPDHFILPIRLIQEKSSLWLIPVEKTNTTVIPGSALLATLKEKLQSAVNIYSQTGQEIKIKIPKKLGPVLLGGDNLELFMSDQKEGVLLQF